MADTTQTVVVRRDGNAGLLAGLLACVLGVLGIFTLGIVFVPLAALCSIVGLIRGLSQANVSGIGVSLLGGALAVAGFLCSPSLWFVSALTLASSLRPPPPSPQASTPVQRPAYQSERVVIMPGSVEAMNQAKMRAGAAMQRCRALRLAGQLKSYAASAECSGPRIIEAYQNAGYRYMDLIYYAAHERHRIAERIDEGIITEAQSLNEYQQLQNNIIEAERQRDSRRR